MDNPIIKTEHLRVIYNQGKSNEVRSLEDINISIYDQEYVIIHGPSGCGKSTLLYAISGLQMPTYGDVEVMGKSLVSMSQKDKVFLHRVSMGMIFQAFYLIPSLTVIDNVCLPKVFMGESQAKRREDAMKLMYRFGIAEQADKFPNQLSGGQKQRVAIARALVNNPKIILADEPVGNLDTESAQNVLDILKELNHVDHKTVIMVTHNAEHLKYADRIISMRDGKVVGEEVITEKRPEVAIEEKKTEEQLEFGWVSNELKILMRTFKSLSASQVGVLLVPYKAKQLLAHIVSELNEEQLNMAEGFLKELLFKNINIEDLGKKLDIDFEKGGANWNRTRANSFTKRVTEIMNQVNLFTQKTPQAITLLADYLMEHFKLEFTPDLKLRFQAILKLRIDNKLDRYRMQEKFDSPEAVGGLGLNKMSAEKVAREIEVIMLIKYLPA
jgi:putative ABC transport system ATP-binding protein